MGKGKFRPPMMGGAGQMNNMMKQIQKMQAEMVETQEALKEQTFEASAGGGAVTAVVSGEKKLDEINIQPEVVDSDDIEMLNDLIVAAVNEALNKADEETAAKMNKFTGGMDLGGLL